MLDFLPLNSRGGTSFELAAGAIIILVLIAAFGAYAGKIVAEAREVALRNELSNLRLALEVYRIRNGGAPKDLGELYTNRDYFVYIDRRGGDNALLDPFGGAYSYTSKTGKITSGTTKYRNW